MSEPSAPFRHIRLTPISARRLALLPALVPLVVGPLIVSVHLGDPVVAQQYLMALAIMAAWLVYLPARILGDRRGLGPWRACDAWVGAFALTTILSVVLSPDLIVSSRAALVPLLLLSYYFLLVEILDSPQVGLRVVTVILPVTLIVAGLGILEYLGMELLPYTEERSNVKQVVLSTLGNPNFVASFVGPVCFLIPVVAMSVRSPRARRPVQAAAVLLEFFLLACVVMTGARGMWLALAGTASLLAGLFLATRGRLPLSFRAERFPWRIPAGLAAAVAIVVLFLVAPNPILKSRFDLVRRLTSTREIRTRIFYWAVAGEMIARNPLIGIGYHRFSTTFWKEAAAMQQNPDNEAYREYLMRVPTKMPGEAHNEFIEIAAEQGFLGLAVFLGMLLWFGVHGAAMAASPATDRERRVRLVYLMSALLAMLVDSLFGFPLQLPASGILFWTLLALIRSELLGASAAASPRTA